MFVNFMKKEPSTKFCDVFDHFSRCDEIKKVLVIVSRCLDVTSLPRIKIHMLNVVYM